MKGICYSARMGLLSSIQERAMRRAEREAESLQDAVRFAWEAAQEISVSRRRIAACVVLADAVTAPTLRGAIAVLTSRVRVPVAVIGMGQPLPVWVDRTTLVLVASAAPKDADADAAMALARRRGAVCVVLAREGALATAAARRGALIVLLHEPRTPVAFFPERALAATLGLFLLTGVAKVSEREMERALRAMGEVIDTCASDVPLAENPAAQVADALIGRAVCCTAPESWGSVAAIAAQRVQWAGQWAVAAPDDALALDSDGGSTFVRTALFALRPESIPATPAWRAALDMAERRGMNVVEYGARGANDLEELWEALQFFRCTAALLAERRGESS